MSTPDDVVGSNVSDDSNKLLWLLLRNWKKLRVVEIHNSNVVFVKAPLGDHIQG